MSDAEFYRAARTLGLRAVRGRHPNGSHVVPKFWIVDCDGVELGSYVPECESARVGLKMLRGVGDRAALEAYAILVRERRGLSR